MTHDYGLDGRIAVVTGGSRGIGRAIADSLYRSGARVAVLDRENSTAVTAARGFDPAAWHFVECDVADERSVEDAISEVEGSLGAPSVLVNNAGILHSALIAETSLALWNRTMTTNVTGSFLGARRVLPGMQRGGYGRLVFIGSSAGKTGAVLAA